MCSRPRFSSQLFRTIVRCVLASILGLSALATARATSFTWNNATGNWSTGPWLPLGTPGASDSVLISTTCALTVDQPESIVSITTTGATSGQTAQITGTGTLTLSNGGQIATVGGGAFGISISSPMVLGGTSYTFGSAGGSGFTVGTTGSISGGYAGATVLTFNNSSNNNVALNGNLADGLSAGLGGLQLNVAYGTVQIGGTNFTSGGIVLSGSTAVFKTNNNWALGSGTLIVSGSGAKLDAASSFTNAYTTPQIWNADLIFGASNPMNFGVAPIMLGGSRTVCVAGSGTMNLPCTISGGYSLNFGSVAGTTPSSSASIVLSGSNTYSGSTRLDAGTLTLTGSNGSAASASAFTVNTTATLVYDNSSTAGIHPARLGSAPVTLNGGAFTFKNDAANAGYSGTVSQLNVTGWQAGTLTTFAAGSSGSSTLNIGSMSRTAGATLSAALPNTGSARNRILVGNGSSLLVNGIVPWIVESNANLFATYDLTNGLQAASSFATGADTTWTTTTNVKQTGSTALTSSRAINSFTLAQSAASVLNLSGNTLTLASGALLVTGNYTGSITGGTIALGSTEGLFTVTANTTTITSSIIGSAGLTKFGAGNLTLTGANNLTGPISLNAGTLQIGNGGTATPSITGSVSLSNTATLLFNTVTSGSLTGGVSGLGTLTNSNTTGVVTVYEPAGFSGTIGHMAAAAGATFVLGGDPASNTTITDFNSSVGSLFKFVSGSWRINGTSGGWPNIEIDGGVLSSYQTNWYMNQPGGTITVHGGTVNAGNTYGFRLGTTFGANSPGVSFSGMQDGGIVTMTAGASSIEIGNSTANTVVSYTLTGGTMSSAGSLNLGSAVTGTGSTTFTLSGSAKLSVAGTLAGAQASPANQVFAFNSGLLVAKAIDATKLSGTAAPGVTGTFFQCGGTLAPGDIGTPGRTAITGGYSLSSSACLPIDIGGANAASGFQNPGGYYDNITATNGAIALGGTLTVTLLNGFVPSYGNVFTILASSGSNATVTGSFQNIASGSRIYTTGGEGSFLFTVTGSNVQLSNFFTIGALPQVIAPPKSVAALPGASVTLGATVSGSTPMTFQWYLNGTAVAGAISPWLSLGTVQAGESGAYTLVATNPYGSGTSSAAVISLNTAIQMPSIRYELDQAPALGNGVIVDAAGNANGTLEGALPLPVLTAGATTGTGNAWDFTNANAWIGGGPNAITDSIGDPDQTLGITVAMWVKCQYLPGTGMDGGYAAGIGDGSCTMGISETSGSLAVVLAGGAVSFGSAAPLDGAWHHVAATFDFQKASNNAILYIDGSTAVVQTIAPPGDFSSPGTGIVVGASGDGTGVWPGAIDQFVLQTRALTATEVGALFGTGTVAAPAPAIYVQAGSTLLELADTTVSTSVTATANPGGTVGSWSLASGPATMSFGNATATSTTASFSVTGTYILRYTGTASGQSNYSELTITVTSNPITVLDAGSSQTFSTAANASGYLWTVDSGTVGASAPSFTYAPQNFDVGTHLVSVLKTYASGSTARLNWEVNVGIPVPASAIQFYVSPSGNDGNPGTISAPFRTLDQARNAVRALPRPLPSGGAAVFLRSGTYWRTSTFFLTPADSGTPDAPIVYASYPGETAVISTGTALSSSAWSQLALSETNRVTVGVDVTRIWETDASNLTNKGPYPASGGSWPVRNVFDSSAASLPDVFYNDNRAWLSRYPNHAPIEYQTTNLMMNGVVPDITGTGYLNSSGTYVASSGSNVFVGGAFHYYPTDAGHVNRWVTALSKGGVWVTGVWRVMWQTNLCKVMDIDTVNQVIELDPAATPQGGVGDYFHRPVGTGKEPYWVLNLLEEIDTPGEWCIDFSRNKLYFMMDKAGAPPDGSVVVADYTGPVVQMDGNNVILKGLVFDESLGVAVSIPTGVGNLLLGCTFKNLTNMVVNFQGSSQNGVVSCDLSNLAASGMQIAATGTLGSATPDQKNFIVNNTFTSIGRYNRMYQPGVNVIWPSAGNRLAHNTMYDVPHMGVQFGGYRNTYEYNEISLYGTAVDDNGAYYSYQDYYGDDWFRFNYTHDTPLASAITYDGGNVRVVTGHYYGNISQQNSSCEGQSLGIGLFSQIDCINNLSIGGGRYGSFDFTSGSQSNINNNVAVAGYYPPDFNWSLVTVVGGSNVYTTTTASVLANGPNLSYAADPGFIDMNGEDLRLRPDAQLLKDLPTFTPIPFEMIGIYNDEFRGNAKVLSPYITTGLASFVGGTAALLTGTLVYPQFDLNTNVSIYYGNTDGGANPGGWSGVVNLGILKSGSISVLIPVANTNLAVYYRVLASNPGGQTWSAVTGAYPAVPGAPGTPAPSQTGPGQVALTWSPALYGATYTVKRSLVSGGPYTTVGTTSATSYTDIGLAGALTYYYVISSSNVLGEGPNSPESSIYLSTPVQDSSLLLHLDASKTSTLVLSSSNRVLSWTDADYGTSYVSQTTSSLQPSAITDGTFGRVVDFGTFVNSSTGHWMQFKDVNGNDLNLSTVRSVFVVMKGGNFILGDDNAYDFHRASPYSSGTCPLWSSQFSSSYVQNGTTYLNAGSAPINGTTTAMPSTGYWLADVFTTGNVQASRLANDRNGRTGGQQIAEVLIYNRVLTTAERKATEGYLMYKWFKVDLLPPTIFVPSNMTVEATGSNGALVSFTTSAVDAANGSVPTTNAPASGSVFALGANTVVVTATDSVGNSGTSTFTVTVRDTTPPVVSVPGNLTVEATSSAGAAVSFATSAVDLVSGTRTTTATPASGSVFPIGTTTVSVTARDAANNSGSNSFTVTVRDTTPPALSLTPVRMLGTSASGASVTFPAYATDLVSGSCPVTYNPPSGTQFPIGTTVVSASCADALGNATSGTFGVTIVRPAPVRDSHLLLHLDSSIPSTLVTSGTKLSQWLDVDGGPNSAVQTTAARQPSVLVDGSLGAVVDTGAFVASNTGEWMQIVNGSGSSLRLTTIRSVFIVMKGGNFILSDNSVYDFHRAIDGSGNCVSGTCPLWNSGYASASVKSGTTYVNASTTPVNGTTDAMPSGFWLVAVSTTNSVTASHLALDRTYRSGGQQLAEVMIYDRLLSQSERQSTEACLMLKWFGQDTTRLAISASDVTVRASGTAAYPVAFTYSASDVSGTAASSASPASGSLFPVGTTPVVITATSFLGTAVTRTINVTVNPTYYPVITVPSDLVVSATSAAGSIATFSATATDGTGGPCTAVATPPSGSLFPIGTTTVNVTATNQFGNASSASFHITVVVPPVSAAERSAPPVTLAGGTMQLVVHPSVPGRTYQLQRSDTLQSGSWISVGAVQTGGGGDILLSDTVSNITRRFYRILLGP